MHDGVYVLPAYAGMIPAFREDQRSAWGAPRVCGDDPGIFTPFPGFFRCSPRMRG